MFLYSLMMLLSTLHQPLSVSHHTTNAHLCHTHKFLSCCCCCSLFSLLQSIQLYFLGALGALGALVARRRPLLGDLVAAGGLGVLVARRRPLLPPFFRFRAEIGSPIMPVSASLVSANPAPTKRRNRATVATKRCMARGFYGRMGWALNRKRRRPWCRRMMNSSIYVPPRSSASSRTRSGWFAVCGLARQRRLSNRDKRLWRLSVRAS